jgi:hypothetical protein
MASTGQRWDRAAFLEALAFHHSEDDTAAAEAVIDWAAQWRLWWGYGRRDGSCWMMIDHAKVTYASFALWTRGVVEIQFQHMFYRSPFSQPSMRLALLERLNALEGVSLPEDSITRRPNFRLRLLREASAREQFFEVWAWYIDQIKMPYNEIK